MVKPYDRVGDGRAASGPGDGVVEARKKAGFRAGGAGEVEKCSPGAGVAPSRVFMLIYGL